MSDSVVAEIIKSASAFQWGARAFNAARGAARKVPQRPFFRPPTTPPVPAPAAAAASAASAPAATPGYWSSQWTKAKGNLTGTWPKEMAMLKRYAAPVATAGAATTGLSGLAYGRGLTDGSSQAADMMMQNMENLPIPQRVLAGLGTMLAPKSTMDWAVERAAKQPYTDNPINALVARNLYRFRTTRQQAEAMRAAQ